MSTSIPVRLAGHAIPLEPRRPARRRAAPQTSSSVTSRAGTWRAIISLSATLLIPGCRDGEGLIEPPTTIPLGISGEFTRSAVGVQLYRGGAAVTNAVVSVNGVKLVRSTEPGYYYLIRPELPAGSPVNVKVSAGGATIEATGNVPDRPVLTFPATGDILGAMDTITVTWTSATDPDRFRVEFDWSEFSNVRQFDTPGTARELTVTGSSLWDLRADDTGALVTVYALWDDFLSFTGPVAPGSGVSFSAVSEDAVLRIKQ